MLDSIRMALKVLIRPNRPLAVLIAVEMPRCFYQIVPISTSNIIGRVHKYLINARELRGIKDFESVSGCIYLLGFVNKSEFATVKTRLRRILGPEDQGALSTRLLAVAPENFVSLDFIHVATLGIQEKSDTALLGMGVREVCELISNQKIEKWAQ